MLLACCWTLVALSQVCVDNRRGLVSNCMLDAPVDRRMPLAYGCFQRLMV